MNSYKQWALTAESWQDISFTDILIRSSNLKITISQLLYLYGSFIH